jgi:glucose-6-phosphate 1-dehydrogenase
VNSPPRKSGSVGVWQILALVAMEKPVSNSADDIRDEKVKVLRCLQVVGKDDVIIGQHTAANGIPGYLDDEGVPVDSNTPTFAAMVLHIENDR